MTLKLVKYNSIKSGIAWDLIKKQVVEDKDRVSAQQTDLLIYPNEHIAYHVHKTHGPTPSQIETYISHIFNNEKIKQKLDCEIDILPLKVGGAVKKLSKWRKIKSFAIEVIRPNPNGAIGAKRLKGLLESSAADKVSLQLNAKISEGLNKANISDLINEGDKIVSAGQGRVIAEGINENNQKDSLDSKDVKVKYNEIRTNDRDRRSLAQIILSFFGHIL